MEKREIIIPAKSIKVGENKLPEKVSICETSPFSDGYDYYGEKERLSMIPESEQFLHQNALDLFGQRELMLKEAIYKKDFFARNQNINPDDIDLSEIQILPRHRLAGKLRQQQRPDKIQLHINRSAYVWFGRERKGQKRNAGLLSAMVNFSQNFIRQALNGNFYAEAALVQGEKDLLQLETTIQNATSQLLKIFDQYRNQGIDIDILGSQEPRYIEIVMNRYGAKFALLLRSYDYYNRVYFTLQNKGLLIQEQLKQVDVLDQKIFDFGEEINNTVERINMVQSITRRKVLENEKGIIEKLQQAVKDGVLPAIPLGVLTFDIKPQMVNIQNNDLSDEEIEKLKQIVIENQLVLSE